MANTVTKILVVDDEVKIAEVVKAYLEKHQYEVYTAHDGEMALRLFDALDVDLLVLDRMLPKVSGEDVCAHVRRHSSIPIIMLTAKATEDDKLDGFYMGADDYLTKPFSPKELVVRIQSLLRRANAALPVFSSLSYRDGDLEVDLSAHRVLKQKQEVLLTQSEFKLLCVFLKYPMRVFQREELIALALKDDYTGNDRVIDSHIKNLRNKIETVPSQPNYIITVHGIGYKFVGD